MVGGEQAFLPAFVRCTRQLLRFLSLGSVNVPVASVIAALASSCTCAQTQCRGARES